jgi:hypothetical protein
MNIRIGWLASFGLLMLCSCSNDAGKPEEEPKASIELSIEQPKELNELQNAFPQFFNYLAQQDTSFSVSKFENSPGTPLDSIQAFPLDKKRLQAFADYLIYNSDSSLAIDLYSYNYVPVQHDGKTVLEQGEPDTEVALIDTKANTRRRVFFTGPGTSVHQAKWEQEKSIFMAGVEEIGPDSVKPVLWKINLQDKTMEIYNYRDTLHAKVSNFVPESQVRTTRAF